MLSATKSYSLSGAEVAGSPDKIWAETIMSEHNASSFLAKIMNGKWNEMETEYKVALVVQQKWILAYSLLLLWLFIIAYI